jgi:tetratricopeptide (TPR) repeat protein
MTRAVSCAILLFVLAPRTAFSHLPPDEEIVLLTEQIRLHPEDAALLLRRGDLHRAHRDFTRARADYVSASRIDPATASLEFRLGGLELAAGDTRRAKDHLDRHLRKHPDDVQALRMRARALRDLGKPVAAARDLRRAIAAIAPPDRARPDDYLECARALAAAGPEHRDEAIRTLEDGMKVLGPIVSHDGTNVLAIGVWNSGAPSSSDLFLVPRLSVGAGVALTRGPYLQAGASESVTVRWRTNVASDSCVRYGPAPGSLGSQVCDPASTTEHAVTVAGLVPNTRSYYSVGTTTGRD